MANIYAYQPDVVQPNFKPFQANLDLEMKVLLHTQQKYDQAYNAISNLKRKALNINFWNKGEQAKVDAINKGIENAFSSSADLGDLSKSNIANKWTGLFNQFNVNPNLATNYRVDQQYQKEYKDILKKRDSKDPQKNGFHNINFSNYQRRVNEYIGTDLDADPDYRMKGYVNYIDYESKLRELAKDIPEEEWFEDIVVAPGQIKRVHHKGKNPNKMKELMAGYLNSEAITQLKEEAEYTYYNSKDIPGFKNKIINDYYNRAASQVAKLKTEKTSLIESKIGITDQKEIEAIDNRIAELNQSIIKSTPSESSSITDDMLMNYITSSHLSDTATDYANVLGGYQKSVEIKPDEVYFKTQNLSLAIDRFNFDKADKNRKFNFDVATDSRDFKYNVAKDQRDFNFNVAKETANNKYKYDKLYMENGVSNGSIDGVLSGSENSNVPSGLGGLQRTTGTVQKGGVPREQAKILSTELQKQAKINTLTKTSILDNGVPASMRFQGNVKDPENYLTETREKIRNLLDPDGSSSHLPDNVYYGSKDIFSDSYNISIHQNNPNFNEIQKLISEGKKLKQTGNLSSDLSADEIKTKLVNDPDAFINDYELMQHPEIIGFREAMLYSNKTLTEADIPALTEKAKELVQTEGSEAYMQAQKRKDIENGLNGFISKFPNLKNVEVGSDEDYVEAVNKKFYELTRGNQDIIEFGSLYGSNLELDGLSGDQKKAKAAERNQIGLMINSNIVSKNNPDYTSSINNDALVYRSVDIYTGMVTVDIDPSKLNYNEDENGDKSSSLLVAVKNNRGEEISYELGQGFKNQITYYDPSLHHYDSPTTNFLSKYSTNTTSSYKGIQYNIMKAGTWGGEQKYKVVVGEDAMRDSSGKIMTFNQSQIQNITPSIQKQIDEQLNSATTVQ